MRLWYPCGATFCVTVPSASYSSAGFFSGRRRNASSVSPCRVMAMGRLLGSVFNGRVGSAIIVLTVRVHQEVRCATPTRVNRSGLGTAAAPAAPAGGGQAAQGRPAGDQRNPLEAGDGGALARPAGAVRALADCIYPLPPLDAGGGLGSAGGGGARGRGSGIGCWRRSSGRRTPPGQSIGRCTSWTAQ